MISMHRSTTCSKDKMRTTQVRRHKRYLHKSDSSVLDEKWNVHRNDVDTGDLFWYSKDGVQVDFGGILKHLKFSWSLY